MENYNSTLFSIFDPKNTSHFLQNLPGLFAIKDTNKVYLSASTQLETLVGFKKGAAIGKTDFDIPSKAAECAHQFIKLDQQVISSEKKMLTVDIQHYTDGWHLMLVERAPLKDQNNKIAGVFSNAIDMTNTILFKNCLLLSQIDIKFSGKLSNCSTYILDNYYPQMPLTKRQHECLFFLVRGKTIKEIAKILALSPRTIEDHLEKIKISLACQTKSQIIEKAIDNGFIYFIPKGLFNERLTYATASVPFD